MGTPNVDGVAERDLSRTLSALADATRRAMLARLAEGNATAGDLARPFAIGLPTVSKHLRALEDAGLVTRERQAQWHIFHLRPEPLADVARWLQAYGGFWTSTLDSLQDYVRSVDRKPGGRKARGKGGAP